MEQKTDEMKAIRVDVHNVDVEAIKQELKAVSDTWLKTLQEHYDEHKQDITDVKTVLSGHSKYFEEHGKRLGKIEETQEQILKLLQQKSGE
jgi:predicted nuclease with TOPRIM domain